jgi:hypothetical protein
MDAIPTARETFAPEAWDGETIYDMEWPVTCGYKIQYKDGSVAYYPEWQKIPNQIITLQERGSYEGVTVSAWKPTTTTK